MYQYSLSVFSKSSKYRDVEGNTNNTGLVFVGKGQQNVSFETKQKQSLFKAPIYILDNAFIRYGNKMYRKIAGIAMRTNCALTVADCFSLI